MPIISINVFAENYYVQFYIDIYDVFIVTWPWKYLTHLLHWIHQKQVSSYLPIIIPGCCYILSPEIIIFNNETFQSNILFLSNINSTIFGLSVKCSSLRFNIYSCRAWCNTVYRKKMISSALSWYFFLYCFEYFTNLFCIFIVINGLFFIYKCFGTIFIQTLSLFLVIWFSMDYVYALFYLQRVFVSSWQDMFGNLKVSFYLFISIEEFFFFMPVKKRPIYRTFILEWHLTRKYERI